MNFDVIEEEEVLTLYATIVKNITAEESETYVESEEFQTPGI